MYENDSGISIYMSHVFLPYYWGGDNVWKQSQDTKQFLLILISRYVEISLI